MRKSKKLTRYAAHAQRQVFGPKYSDFDREVQKHKGFVAPKPKPKEKKKAPPALAESGEPPKKRRRLPDIWMAVPLVGSEGQQVHG